MMHTLTYTSNRAGTVIDLADPEGIMCGQILELRTRTWEFELGYRSLRATRPAKTVKVTGLVYGIPALEKAEELFDADMYAPQRCRETRRHHGGRMVTDLPRGRPRT